MRDQVRPTIEAHCQFCQNFGQVENGRKNDDTHLTISEGEHTLTAVDEKVGSAFKLEDMSSILVWKRGQSAFRFRIHHEGSKTYLSSAFN